MKRLALFLALATALIFTSPKAEAITIELSPSSATIGLSDSVNLDVLVTGLGNEIVSAYDLFLSFDPSIVTATAVTFGPHLGDPLFLEVFEDTLFGSNYVNFAALSLLSDAELDVLQSEVTGGRIDPLLLATITFDAAGPGTSSVVFDASLHPLQILDVKGRDAMLLDLTSGPGQITVVGEPAPEPSSLLLMALGLLALRKRRRA